MLESDTSEVKATRCLHHQQGVGRGQRKKPLALISTDIQYPSCSVKTDNKRIFNFNSWSFLFSEKTQYKCLRETLQPTEMFKGDRTSLTCYWPIIKMRHFQRNCPFHMTYQFFNYSNAINVEQWVQLVSPTLQFSRLYKMYMVWFVTSISVANTFKL